MTNREKAEQIARQYSAAPNEALKDLMSAPLYSDEEKRFLRRALTARGLAKDKIEELVSASIETTNTVGDE